MDIVGGMERVLGIGGYFFRAKDPEALAAWYEINLGIANMSAGGSWEQEAGPTAFAPFPADTDYFGRPDQQARLNFRVANLDAVLTQLRAAGANQSRTPAISGSAGKTWSCQISRDASSG